MEKGSQLGVLEKMRIQAIPVEDKTSASRRIRYKTFMRWMPEGIEVSRYDGMLNCDVLYIQKLLRPWTINVARIAKKTGIPVVYDVDDIRENWTDKPYDKMIAAVNVITTDTYEKAEALRKHTDKPVVVVPDTIDYNLEPETSVEIRPEIKRVVTFGRWQNLRPVADYFKEIDGEKIYISDRPIKELSKYKMVKWDAKTFISELMKCDLAVLSHHPHQFVNMKSNNRLLVCMAIGLPVIASPSNSYMSTLEDSGLDWLCVKPDVSKYLEYRLKGAKIRKEISGVFKKYSWEAYHPKKSSQILYSIFKNLLPVD